MPNHDYKAIADRLVERGIGERLDDGWYQVERRVGPVSQPIQKRPVRAVVFCHDWRVAGRCLEIEPEKVLRIMRRALSLVEARKIKLTLAIILAYLEAQSDGSTQ